MTQRAGLYVHIPFCSIKCYYCDFTAFAGQGAQTACYLRALEAEARLYPRLSPSTLYIGGGTPSELSASELEILLAGISRRFGPIARMKESSVEANPESLSEEKLEVLSRLGVGRLSLGLQAAQDRLLKAIGREHSWEDFKKAFRAARARSLDISVDLMFGLPGQSSQDAMESLDMVLALEPDHVSLYSLQVEERTLFGKRGVEINEDMAREVMESSIARLAQVGFRHYEISNFARPGKESIHNLNYWQDGPYLGLGCGAAGFMDGFRYQNEDRLAAYCGRVLRGERPVAFSEKLEGKAKLGETILLGLRRIEGMALTPAMQESFRQELGQLAERGLVELGPAGCSRKLPRLRLSWQGIFLANQVFREFAFE